MHFLSEEWLAALDEAAATSDDLRDRAAELELVIQQTVTDAPDGEVTYHIALADGTAHVHAGPAAEPTVSLTTDYETAAAIAQGRESAQAAFMRGRLRVGGDVAALLGHAHAFAELDDVFSNVRDATEY